MEVCQEGIVHNSGPSQITLTLKHNTICTYLIVFFVLLLQILWQRFSTTSGPGEWSRLESTRPL